MAEIRCFGPDCADKITYFGLAGAIILTTARPRNDSAGGVGLAYHFKIMFSLYITTSSHTINSFVCLRRVKMYGRKYQWLIMGTYSEQWWKEEKDSTCSLPELTTALEGAILTDYLPLATNKVITISGYVSTQTYRLAFHL